MLSAENFTLSDPVEDIRGPVLGDYILSRISTIFHNWDNFCDFLFAFLYTRLSLGKGLDQGEQIITFYSRTLLRCKKKTKFFILFPENSIWHFISLVLNLHEIANPIFWGK